MKRIKVCMVTHQFRPEYNGAAAQCFSLSKQLARKGCSIIVATFTNDLHLPSQEWIDEIDVRRIYVKPKGMTGPLTALKLLLLLIRERHQFDIVHFHGFINHLLWIAWLNLLLRKKLILKISLLNYDTPRTMMKRGLFHRLAYRRLSRIIATTSAMKRELDEYPSLKSKGMMIPNGVDTQRFLPADTEEKERLRENLGLPAASKIMIFSGAISSRKGADILLEAWEMLYRDMPDFCPHLLLAGPFQEDIRRMNSSQKSSKQATLKMAEKYPERIILSGLKQNIEDYYRASDVFVLPSRNEGMPNSLLEAMACGLNSVVLDFPGVRDVIGSNGVRGTVFKGANAKALYEALLQALNNDGSKESARQTIVDHFSIDKVADAYLQCYEEMI